jgi:LuxR family maltose regulon positive regulatory protein
MVMARPLLETKFYVPGRHRELVPRPRLRERLNRGAEAKLTLVSAPAGFGKTTVLAGWAAAAPAGGRAVAWLSLDEGDRDAASFWTYLIAALRTAVPGVGAGALSLLQSHQPPPIETVLALLLNELGAVPNDVVLVLDDYHVIDARDVHDGMGFLLDHLPPRVHLVLATRADPTLPLARLRARGELVELRAADLRFTPGEAAAYLNEAMGLDLAARDVAALEGRTEGWIAALQLAALSMQGRDDVAGFVAGFAGDDRYVVDYLVEEVLQRQPESIRSFLLQTSILDRLGGPLCDAVTGQDDGRTMLEALERGNLFVVPLDDRRRWYRYHHLFADMLRARLLDEQPGLVPELHRRASAWYERNGEASEAVRHALAAGDFAQAADLVELVGPALRRSRREATLLGWLGALPADVLRRRPVLNNAYAGLLLSSGQLDGVEARLRDAEQWLEATTFPEGMRERPDARSAGMVVVDEDALRRLPGSIAVHRAGLALVVGDVADAAHHARQALDLAPEDDHLGRGGAAGLLGLAAWTAGDLAEAHRMWSAGMASLQRAGYVSDALSGAVALADIRITQGRLGEAMQTYERALRLATEQDGPALRGTADIHVGMSKLHLQRDELAAATRHLLSSQALGEHAGLPRNRYRWRVAMAGVRQAQGDLDGALDLLHEAERLYVGDFFPDVRPVAAAKTRVWVRQGRVAESLAWAAERGLSAADDLSYLREFEHITLARVLLAPARSTREDHPLREATALLGRLLNAAEAGGRTGSVIELLVLQALAHQIRGDVPAALAPLERALALGGPAGYVRVFVDEGPAMAALLDAAAERRTVPEYARRLLAAFGGPEERTPVARGLVEPLSERELDVLRLLVTELGGPEIARELVVSLNTVRTHTRNIYGKLGVNSRRAAVRRAEELGFASRARTH